MMNTHPDLDSLDEPRDIARALKVSLRTVQRMADDGDIPYYRVRGQLRFDLAEVRAALRVERTAA